MEKQLIAIDNVFETVIFADNENNLYSFEYISLFDNVPTLYCKKGYTAGYNELIGQGKLTSLKGGD